MIPAQRELDLRMRQKTQPVTNLPRDSDLPLGRDLHGNTPTSKNISQRGCARKPRLRIRAPGGAVRYAGRLDIPCRFLEAVVRSRRSTFL
jgi:hypothetical protein